MKIDEHIKNLEEYCQEDDLFEKDGDFKEFCDNHIVDIKAVINELKTTQSDLYEANNRINDLLDILKQKDKMIDLMVDEIYRVDWQSECGNSREAIKKYFEKRCEDAKD